jgi:hypothetical protein
MLGRSDTLLALALKRNVPPPLYFHAPLAARPTSAVAVKRKLIMKNHFATRKSLL